MDNQQVIVIEDDDRVEVNENKEPQNIHVHIEGLQALTQNSYYRTFRGSIVISERGRTYKEEIRKNLPIDKIKGKVRMELMFGFRDKRKRDLDNLNKPLIDAMKNIVIEDDDQIWELIMKKEIGLGKDYITIKIQPM